MTFIDLPRESLELFTLTARRSISLFSGTNVGITGSETLLQNSSPAEKQLKRPSVASTLFDDSTMDGLLNSIVDAANKDGAKVSNISDSLLKYMELVRSSSRPETHFKTFSVRKISPIEPDYSHVVTGSMIKQLLKKTLFPYYRTINPRLSYAFTNYNSLNFFTASGIPSNTALLYPNSASAPNQLGFVSGAYSMTGAFTVEFYINPRYTADSADSAFAAGTILHLSSTYAVSLITGSSRDQAGFPNGFKLLLQLSHSADVKPSVAQRGGYPNDLIFSSSDNSLRRNKWHHCAIRWGGAIDAGTGSFIIDGAVNSIFNVKSASIAPLALKSSGNPDALCIGNFYEGINSGASAQHRFFSTISKTREGTIAFQEDTSGDTTNDMPVNFAFNHPLNAELHEIRLHQKFLTLTEIASGALNGPDNISKLNMYVPVMFRKSSPQRWMLQTPFYQRTGSSETPINTSLMFSVGGHDLNVENFVTDFATGHSPRLLYMTSSRNTSAYQYTASRTPNDVLFDSPSHRKRNLLVLPCDNGAFRPNFSLLLTGAYHAAPASGSTLDRYTDDNGALDLSIVSLTELVSTASFGIATNLTSSLVGPTHQFFDRQPEAMFSRLSLLGESDSSAVTLFVLSNRLYGSSIEPGSVTVAQQALTCSSGKVRMTLVDNGAGILYRGDAQSKHAKWNSVGSLMYSEGIICTVAPTIPFFGKESFSISAKSMHEVNVMKINALAPAGAVNSSSNKTYTLVSSSLTDTTPFVYITDVSILNDDLDIIMRASLAQPIKKRENDSIMFRLRMDF